MCGDGSWCVCVCVSVGVCVVMNPGDSKRCVMCSGDGACVCV